jgi:phage-related protein
VAVAIDTFLSTEGGVAAFNWVNPFGVSVLVKCSKWNITATDDEENSFNAVFEEVRG